MADVGCGLLAALTALRQTWLSAECLCEHTVRPVCIAFFVRRLIHFSTVEPETL